MLGREGELRLAINIEGERDKEIKGRRRERSERDAGKGDARMKIRERKERKKEGN